MTKRRTDLWPGALVLWQQSSPGLLYWLLNQSAAPVDLWWSHLRVLVLFKSLLHHGLEVLNSCGHTGIKLPSSPQLYIIHTYMHNHNIHECSQVCLQRHRIWVPNILWLWHAKVGEKSNYNLEKWWLGSHKFKQMVAGDRRNYYIWHEAPDHQYMLFPCMDKSLPASRKVVRSLGSGHT